MNYPAMPGAPTVAPESAVVQGIVTGVEVKANGRFVVKVKQQPTDEYDAPLHTKDAAMAQFLQGQVGQAYQFKCGLSHYVHNVTGQQVTSKWINEYAPMGQNSVPQPQPVGQAQASFIPAQPSLSGTEAHSPGQDAAVRGPRDGFQPEPNKNASVAFQSMAKGLAVECFKRLPTEQQTVENAVKIADYWALCALHRGQHGIPDSSRPTPSLDPAEVYDNPNPLGPTGEMTIHYGGDQPPTEADGIPF